MIPDSNSFLQDKGLPLPKATSTGTTIVGCLFKDGIVLGADTRATEGPIVADKNCEKVFQLLILDSLERPRDLLLALDSLHLRQHPVLRCGYRCRYRVHDRSNCIQHAITPIFNRSEAAGCHCHDDAQADAFPVGFYIVRVGADRQPNFQVPRTHWCRARIGRC
jgi:hypothetical protein